MAPHWPVSGGPFLQGAGGQHSSFQSTNVLNWINKDCSFGNAQPYIVSGLWYNLWGRAILQVQAVLALGTNESSDNYKRVQPPLLGHWSRASHTLLKTTTGLWWPRMDWSMAPSWGKIKTGPTSSTEIPATRTHRTFRKSLELPVFVIHKKTNNRLGLLHDLKGINATVNQWRTSSQGSLLHLRFLKDITILYLT